MNFVRRIFLFLAVNFLVVLTISLILNILGVKPYITAYGLNYQSLLIFCLVWGMGGALISLSLSRIMAKWLMRVKIVDQDTHDQDAARLVTTVYALARSASLSTMPEVGIYESPELNAFATGPTQNRSLVAVSSGLLKRMTQKELEGVIGHEIAHIANGDMVTMTLLQGVVNAFVMFLARALAYVASGVGQNSDDKSSSRSYLSYNLFVIVFEIGFMILGSLIVASYSRFREYRADRGGCQLAGRDKMIAALQALQRNQQIYDQAGDHPSLEAMKISSRKKSKFTALFSSHPSLDMRIQRLQEEFFI